MKKQGISQAEIESLMARMPQEIDILKLNRDQIIDLQEQRLRDMLSLILPRKIGHFAKRPF